MSASTGFQSICVIHGKSRFLRREALARIVARELQGGDPAVNLRRFDGAEAIASDVLDEVRTYTLLGGRRVVIVDAADKFIKEHRGSLERFVASPSQAGCLILVCNALDSRTRFSKAVKKTGEVVECKPATGRELIPWLMDRARRAHDKRLAHRAAVSLREHAGTNQEDLDQELAKLSLYVGRRADITSDDVEALVGCYREQNVFAVVDAVSDGDAKKALQEWHQVLATDPSAAGRGIGGLAWGIRRLLDAQKRLDAGESLHALARACWTDHEVFARRMRRTSIRQREDQLMGLLAADLDAKTGLGTFATTVEKFIVQQSLAATP